VIMSRRRSSPPFVRLVIDASRCDGHGICALRCPELISLDEWGYANVDSSPAPTRSMAARARWISSRLVSPASRAVLVTIGLALAAFVATGTAPVQVGLPGQVALDAPSSLPGRKPLGATVSGSATALSEASPGGKAPQVLPAGYGSAPLGATPTPASPPEGAPAAVSTTTPKTSRVSSGSPDGAPPAGATGSPAPATIASPNYPIVIHVMYADDSSPPPSSPTPLTAERAGLLTDG